MRCSVVPTSIVVAVAIFSVTFLALSHFLRTFGLLVDLVKEELVEEELQSSTNDSECDDEENTFVDRRMDSHLINGNFCYWFLPESFFVHGASPRFAHATN